MKQTNRGAGSDSFKNGHTMMSRRAAVSASGTAILWFLCGSAHSQEVDRERLRESQAKALAKNREAEQEGFQRMLERRPSQRMFFEQMGATGTVEERMKAMQDWQFQRSMEALRKQLELSDQEWTVVQPRLETVYHLRRPPMSFTEGDQSPLAVLARTTKELRELLNNQEARPEEIKAKLTALRDAKEKVRQELVKARQHVRQLMTIRQEAVLVLNDLLD